jgi:NADPH-dependent 2,4-dienoyl-CoA reductase/sulfur reductase-like enzyme
MAAGRVGETEALRQREGWVARLVVIGGGAAGMSAASAARRTDPGLEVIVCEAGPFAAYGMCGIPYYLGGMVREAESLLAYPVAEFRRRRGIDLRLGTRVTGLDPAARQVTVTSDRGTEVLRYDVLVAATGADPVTPPVPGLAHERVFTVRSLAGAIRLRELLAGGSVRHAAVVGAGYIGLETAEALTCTGAEVEVIETLPRVLGTVDDVVAERVAAEVSAHARLRLSARLEAVRPRPGGGLTLQAGGEETGTDLVIVATGVRPSTGLLAAAGAVALPDGSILVDSGMRTSLPGIFAVGDCVAVPHLVLGRPAWVPLGPAANKTGRVAGTVAAGGSAAFRGIVGTAVVKVFGLEVARTGLTLAEATAAGIPAAATDVTSRSRAKYYPGSEPLQVRLVHTPDGRLLGAQLTGREGVAKRIDVVATALHAGLDVSDLAGLDLSYAPPFAPVYDPVLLAAGQALRAAVPTAGGTA